MDAERVFPDYNDPQFIHHLCRYHFAGQFADGRHVLDNGCGMGYGADYLSKFALSVTGVDISEDAVNYAIKTYRHPNLTFRQMNSTELKFKNESFDMAVSFEIIEHLSPYECNKYLKEIKRVVKKGGIILISTPNNDTASLHLKSMGISICQHHINNLGIREFKKLLNSHFESFEIYGQSLRGSLLYTFLRYIDIFNLRLRILAPSQRDAIYRTLVPAGFKRGMDAPKKRQPSPIKTFGDRSVEDYVIRGYMLRQCQTFIAVCRLK